MVLVSYSSNRKQEQLEIESIVGCRLAADNNSFEFKIRWLGFEQDQDTWEPAVTIYEDVPILVTSYIQNMNDNNLKMLISRVIEEHDISRRNQVSRIRSFKSRLSNLKIEKYTNLELIPGGGHSRMVIRGKGYFKTFNHEI
eukprot:snap_masked-scaffold_14-processed-gene-10.27-mRNA-1 protein AED:0.28 eAED:0.28 QI:0/0/0/0.5/1/1/2/0/140